MDILVDSGTIDPVAGDADASHESDWSLHGQHHLRTPFS